MRTNAPIKHYVKSLHIYCSWSPQGPQAAESSQIGEIRSPWELLVKHYPDPEFQTRVWQLHVTGQESDMKDRLYAASSGDTITPPFFAFPQRYPKNITAEVKDPRIQEIHTPLQFCYISPLGAVEKQLNGAFNGYNLSGPHGESVNASTKELYGSLMCQTAYNAIRLIHNEISKMFFARSQSVLSITGGFFKLLKWDGKIMLISFSHPLQIVPSTIPLQSLLRESICAIME